MAQDDVIPLSRFTALPRQRGLKRVDALLAEKDAPARVAAMPVQELFFLIKDVGLTDAHELVALATPEQVQGFLDLDIWDKDRLEDRAAVPWLEALLAAGEEKLTQVWRELDQEVTALLLKRWTRIYNLAEEEVPDDEEPPFVPTPDRFFMVKITSEDAEVIRIVEVLIDRLYRVDAELARHTLRAATSEPLAHLEETAYRWRAGRMADMGYADYYEALEVYRPLDAAAVTIGENSSDRPPESLTLAATLAEPALKQPFLGRVLGQITDADQTRTLETGLVALLNRVLAANRVSPGEAGDVAAGAALGAGTLSLGLETVARGDLARGVEAITTIAPARLHRVGWGLVAKLALLARTLAPRAARADEPYLSLLGSLLAPRPFFPRILEGGTGLRPYGSVADLRAVTHALAVLAAQVTIVFEALGADPAGLAPLTTLGDVGRTAIVRFHLGEAPNARPLAPAELERFRSATPRPGLEDAFRVLFADENLPVPEEFSAAISGWTDDIRQAPDAPKGLLTE